MFNTNININKADWISFLLSFQSYETENLAHLREMFRLQNINSMSSFIIYTIVICMAKV